MQLELIEHVEIVKVSIAVTPVNPVPLPARLNVKDLRMLFSTRSRIPRFTIHDPHRSRPSNPAAAAADTKASDQYIPYLTDMQQPPTRSIALLAHG